MKNLKEQLMHLVFLLSACVSILCVAMICVFLFANGIPAIGKIGVFQFLAGEKWKPGNDLYGVAAPAAMSDEAAAYWSEVLGSVSETDAWKNEYIDANKLIADYMDTTAATEYVTKYEADYMAENGLK